jgi:ATP-dependent Lhr-like helicase
VRTGDRWPAAHALALSRSVTRHLSDLLGEENVAAHHGSLAKEQRLAAEQMLKHERSGGNQGLELAELGIDIGDVDLVCQLGSPRIRSRRSPQRRSSHSRDSAK